MRKSTKCFIILLSLLLLISNLLYLGIDFWCDNISLKLTPVKFSIFNGNVLYAFDELFHLIVSILFIILFLFKSIKKSFFLITINLLAVSEIIRFSSIQYNYIHNIYDSMYLFFAFNTIAIILLIVIIDILLNKKTKTPIIICCICIPVSIIIYLICNIVYQNVFSLNLILSYICIYSLIIIYSIVMRQEDILLSAE